MFGDAILTNTDEILHGLVKNSTPEKYKFTPNKAEDLARTQVEIGTWWLDFTPEKEAVMNYGPGKIAFRAPFMTYIT